ncbi:MAG TPA: flagellar hook-associated protein FlgK, partial [Anaerolineae bacterium]|nr:flagellar hook-associated protein FlgK [Anaerolineae bacterium]
MGSDLLSLGVSGLMANQRSLNTIGHNISNANSEGYSRQRVELGARAPTFFGGGYIGNGVDVKDVERIYDSFLNTQVEVYSASFNQAQTFSRYASTMDELLADPQVGMMPAIEGYFGAMQDVA